MTIKAIAQTTYEIALTEIKAILIKELDLNVNDNIEVKYELATEHHGDQRDNWTTHSVKSVKVIVQPNRSKYL